MLQRGARPQLRLRDRHDLVGLRIRGVDHHQFVFAEALGVIARHALFEALHEHFLGRDPAGWDWRAWPEPWHRPDSPEVAAFAAEQADRVLFFQYLQWLADRQLAAAVARGRAAGLTVGLYRDLAVADHPSGSAAWDQPGAILAGVEPPEGEPRRHVGTVPGTSKIFQWVNRGKRTVQLDLKNPQALAVVHRMVSQADVVVHNYRPGVPKRLVGA